MADLPPKDVCPRCGERGCERVPDSIGGGNPFEQPFRCPACEAVVRYCELRRLTDEERAASSERAARMHREYVDRHRDRLRALAREYKAAHRAEANRAERARYARDPDVREDKKRRAAEWRRSSPDGARAIQARYREMHRHEIASREKRRALEKLREARADEVRHPR